MTSYTRRLLGAMRGLYYEICCARLVPSAKPILIECYVGRWYLDILIFLVEDGFFLNKSIVEYLFVEVKRCFNASKHHTSTRI